LHNWDSFGTWLDDQVEWKCWVMCSAMPFKSWYLQTHMYLYSCKILQLLLSNQLGCWFSLIVVIMVPRFKFHTCYALGSTHHCNSLTHSWTRSCLLKYYFTMS
jgi:hypothetical protein